MYSIQACSVSLCGCELVEIVDCTCVVDKTLKSSPEREEGGRREKRETEREKKKDFEFDRHHIFQFLHICILSKISMLRKPINE